MLNQFEQTLIKQDHSFWTWASSLGDYDTRYIERGSGDRHVLLLHGFAAHTYTWRYQIPFLVKAGYHVWSLDYLGFGLSDKPFIPYRFKVFLDHIQAFVDAMKIPSMHVIGNSMGGSLAVALAHHFSRRVRSLALIDAVVYPIKLPFIVPLGRWGGSLLFPFINPTAVKLFLSQIVYSKESITQEQVEAYLLPYHLKRGKEALIEMIQHFDFQTMMSTHRFLSDFKSPLMFMWGEGDKLVPLEQFYQLSQQFPQAASVLIKQAAHIPQEEQPEQVNESLLSFLKKADKNL